MALSVRNMVMERIDNNALTWSRSIGLQNAMEVSPRLAAKSFIIKHMA
jgi:hypothetical protein